MIRSIGLYDGDIAATPSHNLAPKDKRYDPVVGAGLAALARAIEMCALTDASNTAIIGVTDRGCSAHVAKVTAGIVEKKPRQAFFARAGAQTIATYAAMALDCHGPALTLSGSAAMALTAWKIALQFMSTGVAKEVILLGADRLGDRLVAAALLLSSTTKDAANPVFQLRNVPAPHEMPSPVAYLHTVASALAKASG